MITGCAGRSPIGQLYPNDELSIYSMNGKKYESTINVSNEEIGDKSLEYGGGGALAGAAAGFTCGPWFFICSPLGFIAGGVVGTTTGLVVGIASDLDEPTKVTISEKLTEAINRENITQQLGDQTKSRAARLFTLTENSEKNTLNIYLEKIQLNSHGDDGIALYMKVTAELKFIDQENKKQTKHESFYYLTKPMHINSWIMADETFYQQLFSSAYYYFTEQIIFNLSRK